MMLAVDRDQTVSLMDRAGCAMLGCGEQEILGKNRFDAFVPESRRVIRISRSVACGTRN